MKVSFGSDHGGYTLKKKVIAHLQEQGIECVDYGCNGLASCDYPQYARAAAEAVADGTVDKGIVICTTGIGVSITANKTKGVRCALCHDMTTARMTRLHNDANMLAIGAGVVGENVAMDIVDTFLGTDFSDEDRHKRRIAAIEDPDAPEVSC